MGDGILFSRAGVRRKESFVWGIMEFRSKYTYRERYKDWERFQGRAAKDRNGTLVFVNTSLDLINKSTFQMLRIGVITVTRK